MKALPEDWKKPSAAFISTNRRSSLPWDTIAPSTGPNTSVRSEFDSPSKAVKGGKASPTATFARSPRFSERQDPTPGPASYSPTEPTNPKLGHSHSAALIGSSTPRIELPWEQGAHRQGRASPGPGDYQPPVVSPQMTRSASNAAFVSGSPRFKPAQSRAPGAGAYSPRGRDMASASAGVAGRRSSAFASSEARTLQLLPGDVNPIGPAYDGHERVSLAADAARNAAMHSSSFNSHSPRFRPTAKGRGPGPADYSPRKAVEYSTTRHYSNRAL
jgi:hypothetical protein